MDDNKIFIIGANGQLGTALRAQYPNAQFADVDELDITNRESVEAYDWSKIDIILNAAAYTNVDGAETPEGRVLSWRINAAAVANIVRVAALNTITVVHISSDYVFDGTKNPHYENEDLSPLGVYGQSKAAGDVAITTLPKHYLLRTTWVIGEGNNFVRTMLGLAKKGISPSVVSDQIGRLTFTSELVRAIDHLLTTNASFGTYNVTNGGDSMSWADITRHIFAAAGFENLSVTDISTANYYAGKTGIAPRPLESTMSLDKLMATGFVPRDWQADLKQYIQKEDQS